MVPRWSQDGPRPQEITGECYLRNTLPNAASSIFFVCTGASGMTQHAQNPFPSSSENSKQPKKVRQTQTSTFGAAYLGTVLIAEFKATTSAYKHNQLQGEHPHPPQSPKTKHNGRTTSNLVIGSDRGKKNPRYSKSFLPMRIQCLQTILSLQVEQSNRPILNMQQLDTNAYQC